MLMPSHLTRPITIQPGKTVSCTYISSAARSPEQVKRYSQPLGKANFGQEPLWTNVEFQVMQIHRDKTLIPDLEGGAMPCTIVKLCSLRNGGMQQCVGSPRIDICRNRIPGLVQLEPYGNDGRQPSLDALVAKDVYRHLLSSALQDRVEILCPWDAEDQWHRCQTRLVHPLVDLYLRISRVHDLAFMHSHNFGGIPSDPLLHVIRQPLVILAQYGSLHHRLLIHTLSNSSRNCVVSKTARDNQDQGAFASILGHQLTEMLDNPQAVLIHHVLLWRAVERFQRRVSGQAYPLSGGRTKGGHGAHGDEQIGITLSRPRQERSVAGLYTQRRRSDWSVYGSRTVHAYALC